MKNKGRFFKYCFRKCPKIGISVFKYTACFNFQDRQIWSRFLEEDYSIPRDVPRGHMAVYVGEDCKRYVIKVTLLKNPLFLPLLDEAEEIFGFATGSKLYIPCNEIIFISVLKSVNPTQGRRFQFWF